MPISKQELERLRKVYPLFKFEERNEGENIQVILNDRGTCSLYMKVISPIKVDREDDLVKEHMTVSITKRLSEHYPDLYFAAHIDKLSVCISVWVREGDRESVGITSLDILDPELHDKLSIFQAHAEKSKQDGYFFCTGHQRAEPKEDYCFRHFLGQYCNQYAEEHPEVLSRARRENYR